MNNHNPTLEQLQRGLEIAQKIAELEAAMLAIFQGQPILSSVLLEKSSTAPAKTGKRKLSPQALANIRAAQKRRWAKVNAGKASPTPAAPQSPKAPGKRKSKLSPAGRAKLAAAMKARWAAAKKSGGPAPTASKGKKK
jgi:hypothetical protein